jgi:hypothetical protein
MKSADPAASSIPSRPESQGDLLSPPSPAKQSWRDRIKVHPAAELFPMMSDAELGELGKNILEHGLKQYLTLWTPETVGQFLDNGRRNRFLLDGRNRLEAIERGIADPKEREKAIRLALSIGGVNDRIPGKDRGGAKQLFSRGVLRLPFERHEVGRAGELVVWGFRQGALRAVGRPDQAKFFETFSGLGFLGQVPHLFLSDDPDASIIHPYGTEQTHSFEDMIGIAAHHAGLALISEERRQFVQAEKLWLAPVPPDIPRVAMVGIARLRYQPETQTTVDWQRHLVENAPGFIAKYERVSGSASRPPSQLRLGLFP